LGLVRPAGVFRWRWFNKSDGPDAGGAAPGLCTERAVLPMRSERSGYQLKDEEIAERAVVLQVLRDDHDERWARAELEREIYDIEPAAIAEALERLREHGVVHVAGHLVWASRCAWHLDELGMVSI
jgi:hypothetical protein